MDKNDVFDYLESNDYQTTRFKAVKNGKSKIIEVFDNGESFVAVEIWGGEHLGNRCHLSTYKGYEFELAEDNASSEMFMDDEDLEECDNK